MSTFIFTFIALMVIIIAMSAGVLMGRKPISGSCGGLANVGIEGKCSICGDDPQKCDEEQERQKNEGELATELAYEARSKNKD